MKTRISVLQVLALFVLSVEVASGGPVPMISEVLSCGHLGTPGGLANGVEMERHNLNLSLFPDALCNDGTGAIFYYRPAAEVAHRDKWVIVLQGGGGCGSDEGCAKRWCSIDTAFSATGMTSMGTPEFSINGKGITDSRPSNPIGHWNHVLIKYCSSDGWRGASRDVVLQTDIEGPVVDYRIHFMGYRIIDAVLDTLRRDGAPPTVYALGDSPAAMPDLDAATHIIFAGASAGGSGITHNADRVFDYLRAHNTSCAQKPCPLVARALIDSSFAPSLEGLDFQSSLPCTDFQACDWEELVALSTQAYAPISDSSCLAWHTLNAPGTEWQCEDPGHVVRHHITTPMFIQMGQEDSLVSSNYINAGYAVPGVGPFDLDLFRQTVNAELLALADIQTTAHEGAAMPVVPGVFATRCPEHETLRNNQHIFNSYVLTGAGSLMFFDVFSSWISGSDPSIVITPEGGVDFCGGYAAGDCNFNDEVDLVDLAGFSDCLTGPALPASVICACFDLNGSQRIDLLDYSGFQRGFGP